MTDEGRLLLLQVATAQAVNARLANGEDLGVTSALPQQVKIAIGQILDIVPWMETHRKPLARLRFETAWIHGDESTGGIKPMGMEIKDAGHGTGS